MEILALLYMIIAIIVFCLLIMSDGGEGLIFSIVVAGFWLLFVIIMSLEGMHERKKNEEVEKYKQ